MSEHSLAQGGRGAQSSSGAQGSSGAHIIRARLRSFDGGQYLAEVEPITGPAALLSQMPVLGAVRAEEMLAGREVAVLLWPDVGGLVLGPAVPPLAQRALWLAGVASAPSDVALTTNPQTIVSQAQAGCPAGTLLVMASIGWECTSYTQPVNVFAALYADGAQLHTATGTATANWAAGTLSLLGLAPLAAGDHTWHVTIRKGAVANTIHGRTLSRLLWLYLI